MPGTTFYINLLVTSIFLIFRLLNQTSKMPLEIPTIPNNIADDCTLWYQN